MSRSAEMEFVRGMPVNFNSAYHLNYNMVLNLRAEEVYLEYMMTPLSPKSDLISCPFPPHMPKWVESKFEHNTSVNR